MEIKVETATQEVRQRANSLRFRTWFLTILIAISLVLYCLLSIIINDHIDYVALIIIGTVQIMIHCLYFPDGEEYGKKDDVFISNRKSYNLKADEINEHKRIAKLREFCKTEFEARKKRYFESKLGILGITEEEFKVLAQKSEKEIKHLESFEFVDGDKSRLMFFSRNKRKLLYDLIFKPLPIKENHAETIMSAVESNGSEAIKDGSIAYKIQSYTRRILKATVLAVFIAYVGMTLKDNLTIDTFIQMFIYFTALVTTAIFSFSSGEKCTRVYKSQFYLDLSIFIDAFNEWLSSEEKPIEEERV